MVVLRILAILLLAPAFVRGDGTFVRGDVNQDGCVGIADLVLLTTVVADCDGVDASGCVPYPDAADVDDDGRVGARDRDAFVDLFLASSCPSLPAPFPVKGTDGTPDRLPEPSAEAQVGFRSHGGSPGAAGEEGGDASDGGGSDLQYIHFLRGTVLLQAEESVSIPVILRTKRPLGGVSLALAYEPQHFSRVALNFSNGPAEQSWHQDRSREEGRLGAACLFRHETSPLSPWTVVTLAHLELEMAHGVEPGTRTRIAFEALPLPGRGSVTWIRNEASDDQGVAHDLQKRSRSLEITVSPEPVFVRGEVDGDGVIDSADPLFLLAHLFAAGADPPCRDAADVNDDGRLSVGDAVALLSYLWIGSMLPSPPFPEVGPDPTPDLLTPCRSQPLGLAASN
jgi:hypothetical protein